MPHVADGGYRANIVICSFAVPNRYPGVHNGISLDEEKLYVFVQPITIPVTDGPSYCCPMARRCIRSAAVCPILGNDLLLIRQRCALLQDAVHLDLERFCARRLRRAGTELRSRLQCEWC